MIYAVVAIIIMIAIEAVIIIPDKIPGIRTIKKKVRK